MWTHPTSCASTSTRSPGTDFADAAAAAEVVREVLDELGWVGFPKTSGGRGVHVYVRIAPRWTFVEARRAVIAFAREVERRRPDLITTKWWKEERGERVFIDFNQMARDRTIACAYSLRANPRATASHPGDLGRAARVEPNDFTLDTVQERFAKIGDPHAAIDDVAHDITPLLEWAERDERDGLGDMPYPPDYPKMPGEPTRVQPSRKNPRTGKTKPDVEPWPIDDWSHTVYCSVTCPPVSAYSSDAQLAQLGLGSIARQATVRRMSAVQPWQMFGLLCRCRRCCGRGRGRAGEALQPLSAEVSGRATRR